MSLGKLSYGHAKAIASLNEEEMAEAAKKIHDNRLSVRETERYVASKKSGNEAFENLISCSIKDLKSFTIAGNSITLDFASEEGKKDFLRTFLQNKNRQD